MSHPRYIGRRQEQKWAKAAPYMVAVLIFLAVLLVHSFAARVDVPKVTGMSEAEILDHYSKQIQAEARWRAEMLVKGDTDK